MRKLAKTAAALSTVISTLVIGASRVVAQYYDDWDYTYTSTADEGVLAAITGMSLLCWIPICILSVVSFGFTIWMIIDVTKRDETVLPKKTMWLILMAAGLVTGGWGFWVAVYYFFARKKKMGK
ncbi:hypothetical protein ACFLY9_01580 [Patescibacteria group bacterium]